MIPSSRLSLLLSIALIAALPAQAQRKSAGQVRIYRCTDAAGNITMQNGTPCPRGQQQQLRVMEKPAAPVAPAAVPAVTAAPSAVTPTVVVNAPAALPAMPDAAVEVANPDAAPGSLPPPPLYRCRAYTGNSYLSEDGDPKDRCVSLQVSELAGGDTRSGAEACEIQQDRCERIPDAQLCESWAQYDKQAQSLVALDNPEITAKANALYARTQKVMTRTTCAAPATVGAQNP